MHLIKPINYKILVKIFEDFGCVYSHTKGDHIILHYNGALRPIVIPKYNEIPIFIIKNNMRVVNMAIEKYFELLDKNK